MSLLNLSDLEKEKQLTILIFLLLLVTPFFVWYLTSLSLAQKEYYASNISESCITIQKLANEQEQNRTIIGKFQNKDPLYLQKQIEPLLLLQKEAKELESDPIFNSLPVTKDQKNRMVFLSSSENRFSFVEGKVLQNQMMRETIESQNKAVELDQKDLEKILILLEGSNIPQDSLTQQILEKRPLLLTESAELERKKKGEREVWLFKTKLIKRTFGTPSEAK